ncbi:FmdE family protein [Anaeromyxobacter terrae]|uniref:FmdE family protein n=1 Tax=Anaeromyxobacter terrae TaxID=2925406 RepID=UPI001F59E648|nr:FmdE family protein [Anaeromyxobacter sp. SG22]
MIESREFLEAGLLLHGHKCPAMPLGLRAGAAAMNALAVARAKDKDLLAIVELGDHHCAHCFADGVQMITGCTFGKGNIRKVSYGKFGLTLVDRATGRAVRVVPRADAQAKMKQTPFFQEYRSKGVPASRVPAAVVEPLIDQVMSAPQDQILTVGAEFREDVEKNPETFSVRACQGCGELVVEKYLRVAGDRLVCIPCQEKSL